MLFINGTQKKVGGFRKIFSGAAMDWSRSTSNIFILFWGLQENGLTTYCTLSQRWSSTHHCFLCLHNTEWLLVTKEPKKYLANNTLLTDSTTKGFLKWFFSHVTCTCDTSDKNWEKIRNSDKCKSSFLLKRLSLL